MNKQKIVRIKNELPELVEAICMHKDCPEWLYDGIWDLINDKGGMMAQSRYLPSVGSMRALV